MSEWAVLLVEPDGLFDDAGWDAWFVSIAERLLRGTRVWVGGEPHRFTEIEFYYHGGAHPDTFTHRDPIQRETGLWYFHRTNGVYRGGSFKGHDLTFAGPGAFGGILIRGLEQPNGELVDGPSLSVDYLLARTGQATVASLDEAIAARPAWDRQSPLALEWVEMTPRPILRTARVGLSLKRLRKSELPPRYIMRPYRFLSEPRRISKGKIHMVLALHQQGKSVEQIRQETGGVKSSAER